MLTAQVKFAYLVTRLMGAVMQFLVFSGWCLIVLTYLGKPAHADQSLQQAVNLNVCNAYGDSISVGVGWQDAAGWHTAGWYNIDNEKCYTLTMPSSNVYYHWDSATETNCICRPSISNPQDKGGGQLAVTSEAFSLNNADVAHDGQRLDYFNPTLFTANQLSLHQYEGVDKLVIKSDGTDSETLYIFQKTAIMPLP